MIRGLKNGFYKCAQRHKAKDVCKEWIDGECYQRHENYKKAKLKCQKKKSTGWA